MIMVMYDHGDTVTVIIPDGTDLTQLYLAEIRIVEVKK